MKPGLLPCMLLRESYEVIAYVSTTINIFPVTLYIDKQYSFTNYIDKQLSFTNYIDQTVGFTNYIDKQYSFTNYIDKIKEFSFER